MSRHAAIVILALVGAFLLHDGWMATAGHIVSPTDHAGMAPGTRISGDFDNHHRHHHADMAATGALIPHDAAITPDLPPPEHPTCSAIRIGAPNPVPGLALAWTGGATLPLPIALPGVIGRVTACHAPPVPPPDTQRALLQVYRI